MPFLSPHCKTSAKTETTFCEKTPSCFGVVKVTDIIFAGKRGHGKTLRVIYLTYLAYKSGYKIVTNLKLTGIPYTPFDINTIYKAIQENLDLNEIYGSRKICMALDEITTLGDSRKSLSTENIVLTYLFMQSRKHGIEIFGTLQVFKRLDDTIRRMVEFKVKCKRIGPKNAPRLFAYKYVNQETGQKFWKKWPASEATKYYKFYDTNQPINPQFLNKKK